MKTYEYKSINIPPRQLFSKIKASSDYLEIIKEEGQKGWRFVQLIPSEALPKGVEGVELVFEREIIQLNDIV